MERAATPRCVILIGLLVFAGIAVWQVRSIIGSRYPSVLVTRGDAVVA